MKNQVQLIAYTDRFGEGNLRQFARFFTDHLAEIFQGGVHVLPFYNSIHGKDAGYDPRDHLQVDPSLGTWEDIRHLAGSTPLMADIIVNHISASSEQFRSVICQGRQSPYFEMFLTKERVFDDGVADVQRIYRPRPTTPFTPLPVQGETIEFWTTFTPEQIDIDVESAQGRSYLNEILVVFAQNGIKQVRFDAIGYAIKRKGTSCFMIPETFEFIQDLSLEAKKHGIEVLVEIHSHFQKQIEIGKRVNYVYDFALPPLLLHTLYSGNVVALANWLSISPRNCFTVLDTHDGIGIIDAAGNAEEPGLLTPIEIEQLVNEIHVRSDNESKYASGEGGKNLDIYQINCSYYSALGCNDDLYLMARAFQFFCPGIPQVYYGGFLAMKNDLNLMNQTGVHRDINRPYISFPQIEEALDTPVVKRLVNLIHFRNTEMAFEGEFTFQANHENHIDLRWENNNRWAALCFNGKELTIDVTYGTDHETSRLNL